MLSPKKSSTAFLCTLLMLCASLPQPALAQVAIPIASASDLAKIGNDAAYPLNGHYVQTQDIAFTSSDYSSASKGWMPIGSQTAPFTGVYDGQNHQIRNVMSKGTFGSSGETGLFGVVKGATIQNLGIVDSTFSNSTYLASFYGKAYDTTFINCYANNTVDGKNTAAGLVAYGENTCFHQCFNMGDISGSNDMGGIVGVLKSGSIDTCFNAGSITSTGYLSTTDNIGGIVGDMGDYKSPTDDTIRNCYSTGTVSSRSLYSSGIAGVSENPISSCYFAGSGYKYGICFDDEGTDCYFDQEASGCKAASSMHLGSPLTTMEMKGPNALTYMPGLTSAFVVSSIGYPQLSFFANHPLAYVRRQSAVSVFQPLALTVQSPGVLMIDPNTQSGPARMTLTLDNLHAQPLSVSLEINDFQSDSLNLVSPDTHPWETASRQTSESQLALALYIENTEQWQSSVTGMIPLIPGQQTYLGTLLGGAKTTVQLIAYHGNAVTRPIHFGLQLRFTSSAL